MRTEPYPSDLTDAQWAVLEPLVPRAHELGRPRKTDLREVINAIFSSPSYGDAGKFPQFLPQNRRKCNSDGLTSPFSRCSQDFTY